MLWIDNKLYTFYEHFQERLQERGISIDWIEQAIREPDEIGYSKSTDRYMYDKFIPEANRIVRAVVDENTNMIVTAHYINPKRD